MSIRLTLVDPTNEQINAAAAEHVAGYSKGYAEHSTAWTHKGAVSVLPPFATSADAVLPYVSGLWSSWVHIGGEISVQVHHGPGWAISRAKTFPLACCLAVLKSRGVEVTFTK